MLFKLSYLHLNFALTLGIVNRGAGHETLEISKARAVQSQLDVESTVTLHNLLLLVRMLLANILVETFVWVSYRKKFAFVQVQRQKSEQKHETLKETYIYH